MTTPTMIAAYLALFFIVGALFLLVNLLVGKLVRPANPEVEKLEIYECGEPAIGSSFVQFDLRFYVVALLFIIFDVEVAFFFPWATVYGKATNLASSRTAVVEMVDGKPALTGAADGILRELGVPEAARQAYVSSPAGAGDIVRQSDITAQIQGDARDIALISLADIGVFFAVLLLGFAYVWYRGDLDWVRAVSRQRAAAGREPDRQPALLG